MLKENLAFRGAIKASHQGPRKKKKGDEAEPITLLLLLG